MTTIDFTKPINTREYTMPRPESAESVSVAEFRERIAHLEQLVQRDFPACIGAAERARSVESMRRVGGELIDTTCKRATREDWDRRERAIERSTTLIIKHAS